MIGGLSAGQGNVVSGNRLSAVEISHDSDARSTTGNQVLGNLIGTGLDGRNGSAVFRNGEFGVTRVSSKAAIAWVILSISMLAEPKTDLNSAT